MFICRLCEKTFKSSGHLNSHVLSHTKEKPHKCPQCSAAFGQSSGLSSHVRLVHDGIKRIPKRNSHCPICPSYKCYSKNELQVHVRKHSAELPFACDVVSCGFKTKYISNLLRHGHLVHSDERSYECPTDGCNYKGKTKQYVKTHLRIHTNEKVFACSVAGCTYTCKVKKYLKDHTSRVHSAKKLKCSTCDYRSNVRSTLISHQLTHMKMKRIHCHVPNCDYASHNKRQLELHVDRKHKKKEFACTEFGCNFRCASITFLKEHLKKHELPIFKCPGHRCKYGTRYKNNLAKHISRFHEEAQSGMSVESNLPGLEVAGTASAMKTLHCRFPNCGYQTKFPHLLDHHTATHKKEEKRKHVCPFCFSRLSHLSTLKNHIQRHIREKPYGCSLCKFTAVEDGSELGKHARTFHHIHVTSKVEGDDLRKCRTCGKTCWGYCEFVLHSMNHLQPIVVLERLQLHIL